VLRLVGILALVLASVAVAGPAVADDCRFCLDSVGLQTRDGQAWQAGQPVTLVVHVAENAASPLPATAQVVVMQTDGDRTKCLGVPLKLVQGDASGGIYAGLFFPFRPARYDGKIAVGGDVQDITFDVNQVVAGDGPAGELPAAEPIDTSAPVPSLLSLPRLPAVGAAVLALLLAALVGFARQRRLRQAALL
jgi:hypothetical protein